MVSELLMKAYNKSLRQNAVLEVPFGSIFPREDGYTSLRIRRAMRVVAEIEFGEFTLTKYSCGKWSLSSDYECSFEGVAGDFEEREIIQLRDFLISATNLQK